MVGTALLSGIFGMAGGLVLVGVLLVLLPLPDGDGAACGDADRLQRLAAALLCWRHVAGGIVAAYALRLPAGAAAWSLVLWVPEKPVALIALGLSPFLVKLLPRRLAPDPEQPVARRRPSGIGQHVADAADRRRRPADRQLLPRRRAGPAAIVATKAVCQVAGACD